MSYRRVFLADIASTAAAIATPLRRRQTDLRAVHVQGVCVWCERLGEQQLRVEIDDGTDIALLLVRGEAVLADLQDVKPGKMIKALGELRETPVFASGRSWKRWVDVASLSVVNDPNAESLHALETLYVQKTIYSSEKLSGNSHPATATSIPLLPFPQSTRGNATDTNTTIGSKRKLEPQAPPTPQQPLRSQPVLLMERHQSLSSSSAIKPAEYQFHVTSSDLKMIESGTKTLEIRLNNPPYSIIRANDRIKFNGKTVGVVKAVRKYAQLRSALELETLSSLLPVANSGNASVTINGALRHLRQFISESEESNYGVALFEIQVQSATSSASAAQRSPEEWSKLIYEHVSKAGSGGCTVRDLQFAFPALAVDKIEALLTDLQMDAIVYQMQGSYRLV